MTKLQIKEVTKTIKSTVRETIKHEGEKVYSLYADVNEDATIFHLYIVYGNFQRKTVTLTIMRRLYDEIGLHGVNGEINLWLIEKIQKSLGGITI